MSTFHEAQLVNAIGHSAGAIIFGIFLYLLLRDRSGARLRGSWLSFAAGGLAEHRLSCRSDHLTAKSGRG
jgi:hypothetical protein